MGMVMLPDALVEQDLLDGKLVALMPDYQLPSRPMNQFVRPGSLPFAETSTLRRLRHAELGQALAATRRHALICATDESL